MFDEDKKKLYHSKNDSTNKTHIAQLKSNRYAGLKPPKNKFMQLEKMLKSFLHKEIKDHILNHIHRNDSNDTKDTNNTNNTNNSNDINDTNNRNHLNDTNDINDLYDTNDINDTNDSNDVNDVNDLNDINDSNK